MAVFVYRAADQRGQTIDGVMEAPDAQAVVERLQRDAYYPIQVAPQGAAGSVLGRAWPLFARRRVGSRELVAWTQQLATLLEAGLPLDRALGIQEELAASPRLRAITGDVLRSVRGGASLSDALAKHHPRPFSRLYVNMVRAGEKGGVLEATLKRLGEHLEEAEEFRDTLISALIYPSLLTLVGGAAVIFLLTFVVPRFVEIFRDLGQAIPLPTQILLAVSGWLQRYWWALGLGALAAALALRVGAASPTGRRRLDRLLLGLPVAGPLLIKVEVARFARVAGTLLRSGVPVTTALSVVRELTSNVLLAAAVDRVGDGVRRGTGMAAAMREAGVFPPLATHMVRVGEETGRLEEMLLKVGGIFEGDARRQLKRLIALVEPCIILAMGLVVGFIVLATLLAIFSINDIPI
jgi:general secretion pathway protein F